MDKSITGQHKFHDSEKTRQIGYLLALLSGGIIFLLIILTMQAPDLRFNNEDVLAVTDNWEVSAGGQTRDLPLPIHIPASAGETVTYSILLSGDGRVRNSILLRGQHQYIKVFLDGMPLGDFGYQQSSFLGTAPYAGWLLVRLPDNWHGKRLTIEQTAYYDNYAGILSEVYLGTKNALVFMIIKRCLAAVICNLAILAIGILLFGLSFFTRAKYMVRQIRYLSVFAVITSLWLLLECGGYQLILGRAPIVSNLIFILVGLMPIACLRFLLTYDCFAKSRYLVTMYYVSIAFFLVQQVLQIAGICDYIQSLPGTHLTIILSIAGILWQYLHTILQKEELPARAVYVSCLVFSSFGLIDIFRFYFGNPSDNPVRFSQFGLFLFFLILAQSALQNSITDHENKIKQDFFEHMAFTDLLTGIPNRNAFERELTRYRESEPEAHPLILVADLNDLKGINDTFGHTQGDCAIIAVAHALLHTFSDNAAVFRIGGDEFCAISPDMTTAAARTRCAAFQEELLEAARPYQFPITVAIGCHKEQGEGIDKAFNRADADMYRCKAARREGS